jgi:hypothetical protein
MAYQDAWEWPVAIANVSALIAGGWSRVLLPARDRQAPLDRPLAGAPAQVAHS